jgi:ATP-dependent Clp protease ATP-binding subunit ClpB
MRLERMTTKAQEAIRGAVDHASRNGHPELYPEHLLRELIAQEGGIVAPVLQKGGASAEALRAALDSKLQAYPRVSGGAEPGLSRRAHTLLQKAEDEAKALKDDFISTEHMLLAAAKHDKETMGLLEKAGLNYDRILQALQQVRGAQRVTDRDPEGKFQALSPSSRRRASSTRSSAATRRSAA